MPRIVILVTGASSGFGLAAAKALAEAGHTTYASMRQMGGKGAALVGELSAWGERHADLRTVELDVHSDAWWRRPCPACLPTRGGWTWSSTTPGHGVRPGRGVHPGAAG